MWRVKGLVVLAILCVFASTLVGCGQPKNPLLGSWVDNSASFEPRTWTFYEDGSWTQTWGVPQEGRWQVTSVHDMPAVVITRDTGDVKTYLFSREGSKLFLGMDKSLLDKVKVTQVSQGGFDYYAFTAK